MIVLAKTAGFCFGVDRAVNLVYELLEQGKKVATLGPIIHNTQLVDKLKARGVRIINSPSEARENETVVIRSHGVPKRVFDELESKNISYVDATCPFVLKIHRIVTKSSLEGKIVLIAGDKSHPEVEGIVGHCQGNSYVFSDFDEFVILLNTLSNCDQNKFILLAQTTFNKFFWNMCTEFAKKHYTNIKIFDTICSATDERQNEAEILSKANDLMIVVGGRHSSNTKKLSEVCSKYAKTLLIETGDELFTLDKDRLFYNNIGITAGASTPSEIIKEVLKNMSEILRNESEEMDFATMLEQSLESEKIYNGKRVKGIVTSFNNSEVHVDIGAKQAGVIPASELTENPTLAIADIVKKGDELDLMVVKVNDQEGIVTLSKKRCDAAAGFEKIKAAYESDAILDGIITDVVRGGVLVYTCDTKIFIPASHASESRVENLETLLKKAVKLKVIEVNEERNRAKGSVRAVTSEKRKELQAKFWEEVSVGKKYKGEVKSLTEYGAFVDLGGVDGMIHITELSWKKIKHPSDVVKIGDIVEVSIKDIDAEKKRISLSYKNSDENPWSVFVSKYKVDDVVSATLVSFIGYGAFAEIIPGVDGLIHISQIANKRVEKVADILTIGEVVDTKIIEIDEDKKRVSLSIRALLPDEEQKNTAEEETATVEEAVKTEETSEAEAAE